MYYICERIDECRKETRCCKHQFPHKWREESPASMDCCTSQPCSNINGKCKCKPISDDIAVLYQL